ncbi:MAG: hypothetical protein ACRBBN_02375 [Methyloligellaceae bacterium]
MRCIFLLISLTMLSGCAIDPTSTSQIISGDSSRVNALSNLNKQLSANSSTGTTDTFSDCLSNRQREGVDTLARYLTSGSTNTASQATITITSDNLSAYTTALWTFARQNKATMLETLALHRAHDKTCFEREIVSLKNKNSQNGTGSTASLSDYEQSHKILGNIYDYLHSTLAVTDYSELDEQFARDHIPVKVLLPTT